MKPETIVIIPNFNGIAHLEECLSSIFNQSYKRFKVLLIDDFSSDKSLDFVKINFPKMEIIKLNSNSGFTKSMNIGIIYSIKKYSPKYISLLNNDTRVDKDWLKYLVNAIKRDDKIAAVASNMLFYENPEIINSQGAIGNFIGIYHDINIYKRNKEIKENKIEIIAPCFGATIISVDLLKKIGLPDEDYFSYYEDVDWGLRANIFGFRIIFEKNAIVYHKGSATWKKFNFRKIYLCRRNSLLTIIKNYEFKNLVKVFLPFLTYSFMFSVGQIVNHKFQDGKIRKINEKSSSYLESLKYASISLSSIIWNLSNLSKTLKKRREIQKKRKIKDREIFHKYF